MMMRTIIRMEIKDVWGLMDEAGNFKLSRPTTFSNIRHYSYIDADEDYCDDDNSENVVQTILDQLQYFNIRHYSSIDA